MKPSIRGAWRMAWAFCWIAAGACDDAVAPDRTAPAVAISAPTVGEAPGPTVLLEGTAADDQQVVTVRFTLNGSAERPLSITPGATVTYRDSVRLSEGENRITVIAADAAGNQSQQEVRVTLEADRQQPLILFDARVAEPVQLAAEELAVTGTVTDDRAVVSLRYRFGFEEWRSVPFTPGRSATFAFTVRPPYGSSELTLEATDSAANQGFSQLRIHRTGRLRAIQAAYRSYCGLSTTELFCVGRGIPWTAPQPEPLTALTAGLTAPCALSASGRVYCWKGRTVIPVFVVARAPGFRSISGGAYYGCALTTDGAAYCWGESNRYGELGDGGTAASAVPVRVTAVPPLRAISSGLEHSCALSTSGQAYCWGEGYGATPQPIAAGLTFDTVAAGEPDIYGRAWSCGLTTDHVGYCWQNARTTPAPIEGGVRFLSLSNGAAHWCGLAVDGRAYCWGNNFSGQVGTGDARDRALPSAVAGGHEFVTISASGGGNVRWGTSCALTAEGEAFCWGALDETGRYATSPVRVP